MVQKILKKVKNRLFSDQWALYKKEKHLLNKPFYFEGNNGKAVLLIHGWTCTPYEVRRLGKYLNENGYTVYGPMLRGHGTVPKDIENVKWNEWLEDIEKEFLKLREKYEKVYVGGTSLGANITMLLAEKYSDAAALILMAAPYKFKLEKLSEIIARIVVKFQRYRKKTYPPTLGAARTITRLISYQTYPVKSIFQAFELVKKSRDSLFEIKQPCLMIQSTHDHMVVSDNMEQLYDKIGSKIKKKKYIKRAYHTFISDIKNEHVFKDILNFLNKN
ncbi:MAG TPA: alpha/beta fold hydrolase [Candidatus Moranbacteria bacterium]|nr:alpha/beta fold hydrolase [Candidatus Moranbacteria bacterium]